MNYDISSLSNDVVALITPFFPYLVKAGKLIGQGAVARIGELGTEETFEKAKKIWEKLNSKKNQDLTKTAKILAENSHDIESQKLLSALLLEMLSNDKKLKVELSHLILREDNVQDIIADDSQLRNIRQENTGRGKQKIKAKKSTIEGVTQSFKK